MAFDDQPSQDPEFCYAVWLSNGSRTDIMLDSASSTDIDDSFRRYVRLSPPARYDEAASTLRLGGSTSSLSDAGMSLESSYEYYEFFTLFSNLQPEHMGEHRKTRRGEDFVTLIQLSSSCTV